MLVQPVGHSRCLQEKDVPVDATEHIRDVIVPVDPMVVMRGSVNYDHTSAFKEYVGTASEAIVVFIENN